MSWVPFVVVAGVVVLAGVVGQLTGVMDFRSKKGARATSGNILAPIDGLFAPNRQEAMQELERQAELPAPAPTPGDGPSDVFSGRVRIDLSDPRD